MVSDSKKLDEIAELLQQLEKRRGLSVQQVIGVLVGSLFMVFVVGPIGVIIFGTVIGPIASSVFIAVVIIFLVESLRSYNFTKRLTPSTDEETQESLDDSLVESEKES